MKHSQSRPILALHLATGLRGQLRTEDGGWCQRLGSLIPPSYSRRRLRTPKAREDAQEPPSRVLLDGIRGPAGGWEGVGLWERGLTLGDHEGISEGSRRKLRF